MGKKSRFLAVRKRNKHRRTKIAAVITMIVITLVMVFVGPAMFFNKEEGGREEIEGFKTVSYDIPTDGSLPTDHSGLENIGYMARRLSGQVSWYSEMHGVVDTMIQQRVDTYKQYSDGILISADISASSMVKTAKQLCFTGDYVLWREAVDASKTDGINTAWRQDEPTKVDIDTFKNRYGLPGTEFSVYIINEETLLGADAVVDNGDGTYSQTFHLDPATDKAPYYYCQQMKQTGGLDDWPVFEYIDVTYTFDSTWQVLRSEITEKYKAKMVVSVGCTASYVTTYEYNTDKAKNGAYEEYFSLYADKPVSDLPEGENITAVKCLTQAFGSVLTGPATFALDLNLGGAAIDGTVYIDIATMDVRARIGNVYVWYTDDCVYLEYDNVKARMGVNDLMNLVSGLLPSGMMDAGLSLDTDALVAQLGEGEFKIEGNKASLSAVLELFGMTLPVDFQFNLGENNAITLDCVGASVAFGDFTFDASLGFGTEELPALTAEQKQEYIDLIPYANTLIQVFTSDALNATISYEQTAFSVNADLKIGLKELGVVGDIGVRIGDAAKTIGIAYAGETVYLNLDGIKLSANVTEALALVKEYVTLPQIGEVNFDLAKILGTALSPEFAANFSLKENDDQLAVALKGTELLAALSIDFALGDVVLTVSEGGISASVLGAEVCIGKGEAFTVDTNGYTDIVGYAGTLAELFTGKHLQADVSYRTGNLGIAGTVNIDLDALNVGATFDVTYQNITKQIVFGYDGEMIYVNLDGIKVKGSVRKIIELVTDYITIPETDIDANALITKALSINFGEVVSLGEKDDALRVTVKGTELLRIFGAEFALGDIVLTVTDANVTVTALGVDVTLRKGAAFTLDTDGYVDVSDEVGVLADIFSSENLQADIRYGAEDIGIAGTIQLNVKTLNARAALDITYRNVTKTVILGYDGTAVYADLDGIKVKGTVEEVLALVTEFVTIPKTDLNANALVAKALSMNFGELVALTEEAGALDITIDGTELLNAFGIKFDLGKVTLSVGGSSVTATAYGATLTVQKGETFTVDTVGYTDIVKYVQPILDLFKADALSVQLGYTAGALTVDGTLRLAVNALNLNGIVAEGDVTVSYQGIQKTLHLIYSESQLYLGVDGIKVSAGVDDIVSLVKQFVEIPEADVNANEMIEKALSLHFGEIVKLSEGNDTLGVIALGTQLLKAFGIDFDLGDVSLNIGKSQVGVSVLGINLTITAAESFTASVAGYTDISAVLGEMVSIIENQAVSFRGSVDLVSPAVEGEAGKTYLNLDIKEGALSWKRVNGKTEISVFLDATMNVAGTRHDIYLEYAENTVRFAYGKVGAEVSVSEFESLKDAFVAAYNRVRATVGKIAEKNPVPAIEPYLEQLDSMLALFKGGNALSQVGANTDQLANIINNLSLGSSKDGICTIGYGDFSIELLDETAGGNGLSAIVSYNGKDLRVLGDASVRALKGTMPTMPSGDYLTGNELAEMLDYIATAVEMATEENVTLDISGTVRTNDTEAYADGIKYDFEATLGYYSGEKFPIHLDIDNYNFWLATDMYLHAEVNLIAHRAEDTSLWIDLYLLDMDEEGKTNGELDLWASISTRAKGAADSNPLKIVAPAGELMTVLSSALPLMGIDVEILNKLLPEKWLETTTTEQLRAIGKSLSLSLGFDGIFEMLATLTGEEERSEIPATAVRNGLFESVAFVNGENEGERILTVALNSEMIYGNGALAPIGIAITKSLHSETTTNEAGETLTSTRGYLSNLTLDNVWLNGEGSERLDIGLNVSLANPKSAPTFTAEYNLGKMGITNLIKALAVSATHEVNGTDAEGNAVKSYALNDFFYIGGSVNMKLTMPVLGTYDVPVRNLAVKVIVGEKGEISADILLEFDQFTALSGAVKVFKGDTRVDISLKQGMLYVKRTQTSGEGESGTTLSKENPEVLYRAMPLATLGSDMINQLKFLFNFSDTVGGIIESAINGSSSASGGEAAPTPDLGEMIQTYLTSFTFTPAQSNANKKWNVVLNGAALTGGVLKAVDVTIDADENDIINRLALATAISAGSADGMISIDLAGNLKLLNPQNKPVKDETESVSTLLMSAMDQKIERAEEDGWQTIPYVAGQCAVVRYYLADQLLQSQSVVFDPASGELYASLNYPDLTAIHENGYRLSWTKFAEGEKFTGDRNFYVVYTPEQYQITFKSEYPFDGKYTETKQYTYGDKEFVLPTESNEVRTLSHFADADGNIYRTAADMTRIFADTELTAVWNWVNYELAFVYTNEYGESVEVGRQTARFGDAVEYPALERAGYLLTGWKLVKGSGDGASVSANATYEATFEAITYETTLVSEYPLDDFVYDEAYGAYARKVTYRFNEKNKLPAAIEFVAENDRRYFLDGFTVEGGAEVYVEIPALDLGGKILRAKWSEVGYAVTYEADGEVILTQNYAGTAALTLPEVPYKTGNTGEWGTTVNGTWQKVSAGDPVSAPVTIVAKYTPNVYTVTVVSREAVAGYAAVGDTFQKTYEYVYGTTLRLPEEKIAKFDFVGYFTENDGKGDDAGTIENILSDKTVYLHFISNGITVTLKSDVGYAGAEFRAGVYEQSVTLYDHQYDLGDAPKTNGYQQLGWWYSDPVNGWTRVTNIESYGGKEIWALWISEIKIEITRFEARRSVGIGYATIGGTVTGGEPKGDNGEAIFAKLNLTPSYTGTYSIFSDDCNAGNLKDKSDNLKYGKEVTVTDGKFLNENMTSSNAGLYWNKIAYGGIALTATYSYAGGTIKLQDVCYVSHDTYKVEIVDGDGNITSYEARRNFPYVEEFIAYRQSQSKAPTLSEIDLSKVQYKQSTFADYAPALEEREGYTVAFVGATLDEVIDHNIRAQIVYTPVLCPVTLRSESKIEGWAQDEKGRYILVTEMDFDAKVNVTLGGKVTATYTVGLDNNVFDIPVVPKDVTLTTAIGQSGATFTMKYNLDTAVFHSGIDFTMGDYTGREFSDQYNDGAEDFAGYTLPIPEAKNYLFLGWYKGIFAEDGSTLAGYERIESIQKTETLDTTHVYALWATKAQTQLTKATYEYNTFLGIYTSSKWVFEGSATGGEYSDDEISRAVIASLGATVSANVTYYAAKNNTGTGETSLYATTADNAVSAVNPDYAGTYANGFDGSKSHNDLKYCCARLTYTYVVAGATVKQIEVSSDYMQRA